MKPASPKGRVHHIYVSRNEAYKAAVYRWEFLRRNQKYCAEYKEFMGSFGAWLSHKGHWRDPGPDRASWTKADRKYFETKIEPVLTKLYRKWHVFYLLPPELGLEEGFRATKGGDGHLFPPTWLSQVGDRDFRSTRDFEAMELPRTGTMAKRFENLLRIQVDLSSPKKDLSDYFESVLKAAQKSYRKELDERGVRRPRRRRRFKDYDTHIRVWDLKQMGNRPSGIAKLVFPNYPKASGLHNVRDHLKAAERLIGGQYREIR